MEKFQDGGGMISRDRRRVIIVCRLCRHHRYVSLAFALHFRPCCIKCGAEARIQL
jgi:hypothetical protein